ncbi:unnamed protein product [Polarella glacialis]|uniref:2Fe-2S ferredoxin-type domain-containing protein n=1 Tax=Polarella glacialis TaxID=89957 RepID=A0A813GT40_POLGL|nr:unnamed protein product [Polarella glacialis]
MPDQPFTATSSFPSHQFSGEVGGEGPGLGTPQPKALSSPPHSALTAQNALLRPGPSEPLKPPSSGSAGASRRLIDERDGERRTISKLACYTPALCLAYDTGASVAVQAKSGQTLLEVAHSADIDIEGACGGECACSTCHVILTKEDYAKMPEPDEDEAPSLLVVAVAYVCLIVYLFLLSFVRWIGR